MQTQFPENMIGRKAQSTILTEISESGSKVFSPAQEITAFEDVEMFQEKDFMFCLGGEFVLYSTLFNIS